MAAGILSPNPIFQAFGPNGQFLAGGLLYTYAAGTNTPIVTYQDAGLTQPNTNPITLGAYGQAEVWLSPGIAYKFNLTDQFGNEIPGYPVDQIFNASAQALSGQIIGSYLYPSPTPAELKAGVIAANNQYPEGDIRRYNASTVTADNSLAINQALLVSAYGGQACYIPPGTWSYTSTLVTGNVTNGSSSMYGSGRNSILSPSLGIDGLTFVGDPQFSGAGLLNSPGSSRFFRDFALIGPSLTVSNNNGLSFPNGITRLGGILFQNLTIQNFAYGVNLQMATGGLWISMFLNCYIFNCYFGYRFFGQAIDISLVGGFVQIENIAAPTSPAPPYPNSVGLSCDFNTPGNVEGLSIYQTNFYGYATGLSFNLMDNVMVTDVDISQFSIYGIFLGANQGGVFIKGTYIQASPANNATAVYIQALGTAINDKTVIESCELLSGGGTGTVGVFIGTNQAAVTVRDSTIGSQALPFVTGFSGNGNGISANNSVIEGNSISATGTAISVFFGATNSAIRDNFVVSGTPLVLQGAIPGGLIYSYAPTPMTGTQAVASNSAIVTFTTPLPTAVYSISIALFTAVAPPTWWISSQSATSFAVSFSSTFNGTLEWSVRIG